MADQDRVDITPSQSDFWSQVPVVLFTIAAIVALVVVNTRTAEPEASAEPATGTELRLDPVNCADCGEIIAIRPVDSDDAANPDQVKGAVLIEVRMSDGSVRTVKQQSTGYKVGDRVQVNGDALAIRG